MIGINKNHYNNKMYYKIILKNNANKIAECIYGKIREIKSENRDWLVNNTNGYIFNHLELPLYSKEDLENVIYEYGIQKAIEKFILNKKIYDNIITLVDNDDKMIYLGVTYYIISEYFEFMSFEY